MNRGIEEQPLQIVEVTNPGCLRRGLSNVLNFFRQCFTFFVTGGFQKSCCDEGTLEELKHNTFQTTENIQQVVKSLNIKSKNVLTENILKIVDDENSLFTFQFQNGELQLKHESTEDGVYEIQVLIENSVEYEFIFYFDSIHTNYVLNFKEEHLEKLFSTNITIGLKKSSLGSLNLGMKNYKYNCSINCLLQILNHIPSFKKHLFTGKPGEVTNILKKILFQMNTPDHSNMANILGELLLKLGFVINDDMTCDVSEIFHKLSEKLYKEHNDDWSSFCPMDEFNSIVLENNPSCDCCNTKENSGKASDFTLLTLYLPENGKIDAPRDETEGCFSEEAFSEGENLVKEGVTFKNPNDENSSRAGKSKKINVEKGKRILKTKQYDQIALNDMELINQGDEIDNLTKVDDSAIFKGTESSFKKNNGDLEISNDSPKIKLVELLDSTYNSTRCGENCPVGESDRKLKPLKLFKAPNYLMLLISRTKYIDNKAVKDNRTVLFDEELILAGTVADEIYKYRLFALIVHTETEKDICDHYTSYVRIGKDFTHFNDSLVEPSINIEVILKIGTVETCKTNPYILFYERIN